MKSALHTIHSLRHDCAGIATVEFVILSVPFLIMLIGGLDLAQQSYVHSVLQGALNDAARRASVEEPEFQATGDTLEARVEATIRAHIDPVAPNATYTITEKNFFEFSGIGNPEKLMTDVDGDGQFDWDDGDCFEDLNENGDYDLDAGRDGIGGANDIAFYEARVVVPRIFPVYKLTGSSPNHTIKASTAFRNQPYSTQAVPPVICGEAS